MLRKAFIDSQFNYAPLLWIVCRKTLYSKIEKTHHKTLSMNQMSNDTYDKLLLQSSTVSVHQKHICLMTETFKILAYQKVIHFAMVTM